METQPRKSLLQGKFVKRRTEKLVRFKGKGGRGKGETLASSKQRRDSLSFKK